MSSPQLQIPNLSRPAWVALLPLIGCTCVASGLLVAVLLGAYLPALDRAQGAEQAFRAVKQQQQQMHTSRVRQECALKAKTEVATLWQGLPTQDEFSSLAVAITELGRSEQVAIPSMAYRVGKAEGPLPVKATMAFKVSGDYNAIYRFIHRLETAESYVVIESLDAARVDKSVHARSNAVVVNVTVATFLRPMPPKKDMS